MLRSLRRLWKHSGGGEVRTLALRIKSPLLCQLSYTPGVVSIIRRQAGRSPMTRRCPAPAERASSRYCRNAARRACPRTPRSRASTATGTGTPPLRLTGRAGRGGPDGASSGRPTVPAPRNRFRYRNRRPVSRSVPTPGADRSWARSTPVRAAPMAAPGGVASRRSQLRPALRARSA